MKSKTGLTRLFCLLVLMLSSCELPSQDVETIAGGGAFSAQIVSPADGAHFGRGVELDVTSLVSSPGVVSGVTLLANDQLIREDLFTNPSFHSGSVRQPWTPPGPGTYALQVVLKDAKGEVHSNTITIIVDDIVVAKPNTDTPTPIPDAPDEEKDPYTDTPTITPTGTITPTPTEEKLTATANLNVNCRRGPGKPYEHVWDFLSGVTAPIVGRAADNQYVVVQSQYGQCWVGVNNVSINGNLNSALIFTPPPLPVTDTPEPTYTPEPVYTACNDYPDLATCNADPAGIGGCSWDTGTNTCKP